MKFHLPRGWWKPWNWSTRTWLFAILAGIFVWPLATRWYYLSQIPDVVLPFDLEQVVDHDIPKELDAFTYYESAAEMLDRHSPEWFYPAMNDAMSENGSWDPRLIRWLVDNSNILAELETGSACEHFSRSRPNFLDYGSSLHGKLRMLTRLSTLAALRCSETGNFEEAWRWHRATLRLARHTEKRGAAIDWHTAYAIRAFDLDLIRSWVSHEELTADQIRIARNELMQTTADPIALSEIMKFEHRSLRSALEQFPSYAAPELDKLANSVELPPAATKWYAWANGQPELAIRLSRQLLVNNLDQIDKPLHLRRNMTRSRYPTLYALGPTQAKAVGQLTPAQPEHALDGFVGRHLVEARIFFLLGSYNFLPGSHKDVYFGMDESYRMANAVVSMTCVVMAAHEFHRSHGEFPARLEELVPHYINAVPFDPMSATGAPLRYRRDDQGRAKVWSVGLNGVDDDGDVDGDDPKDRGYQIFLKTGPK